MEKVNNSKNKSTTLDTRDKSKEEVDKIVNTKQESEDDDDDDDDDDEDTNKVSNKFANDGSFLELFKKMQEQQQKQNESKQQSTELTPNNKLKSQEQLPSSTSATNEIGSTTKRKPKVLKVGVIEKKVRPNDSESISSSSTSEPDSAWKRYMREVRMYKEKYGDEEDKNRPLVK